MEELRAERQALERLHGNIVDKTVAIDLGRLGQKVWIATLADKTLRSRAIEGVAGQRLRATEVGQAAGQRLGLATEELRQCRRAESAGHRTAKDEVLDRLVAETKIRFHPRAVAFAKSFVAGGDAEVGLATEEAAVGFEQRHAHFSRDRLDGATGLGRIGQADLANDIVQLYGDVVVGDIELLLAPFRVNRTANGTGGEIEQVTRHLEVGEVERGTPSFLGFHPNIVERALRHLVAGATKDIQRVRGVFGQRGAEATFTDGIGGDIGRLVVAVEISEIPIKSVQHGALGSEQYGVGIVGDVRLARSNVHRTVVKGDIDAEGIPIVRLGHEDTVVRCCRNGRRGQLNMRLVLLVGQRRVEVDVLRQIITECGIEPEALGFRREPDEVLEIVEVGRRRDTGRQPLRLKRGGGRSVELTVGRVPRSASEVRRRGGERAGGGPTGAG